MRTHRKGSMTIFLSFTMMIFLGFCMVLMEGVRMYYLRVEARQAMDLAEFSVLSEYQYELFSRYGVFFLDLDYGLGLESPAILEKRTEKYLMENTTELKTQEIKTAKFERASDGGGAAFFQQAVELMKIQNGYKFFEELLPHVEGQSQDLLELENILAENEAAAEHVLDEYVDETGMPLFDISLPNISFPSVETLNVSIFGDLKGLSEKSILSEERLLKRSLEKGEGREEKTNIVEMQWFHNYLFQYFNFYGSENKDVWKETLEYQLEYIIAGEVEDFKNLENIMWRIFLMRAGGDYLFYHQDPIKMAEAEAEALAIAGISGNAVLIAAVKEMILISKAMDAAIAETKQIFSGEKVPFYNQGIFSGIEFGYEEYLYLFLAMTNTNEKIYRCMDIVEMEVRKKSEYENFRLDHCTDCFEITWTYQYDSLFVGIPWGGGNKYEEVMKKEFCYEK